VHALFAVSKQCSHTIAAFSKLLAFALKSHL
jgi:hypothetical protein